MCGIIGIQNNSEAATLAYMGLYAQQHRGQEGAGVVSSDGTAYAVGYSAKGADTCAGSCDNASIRIFYDE